MKKILNILILLLFSLLLVSCKKKIDNETRTFTYFDTIEKITIYGDQDNTEIFNKTKQILEDYHIITNRYEEESNNLVGLYTLNQKKKNIVVDKRLIEIIIECLKFYRISDYFNILIGPVSDFYHNIFDRYNEADKNNTERITSLPDSSSLTFTRNLTKIKYDLDSSTISIQDDMSIDLGGIVKGYVSKVLIDYYDSLNLKYTLDFGESNIYTNIGNPNRKNNAYIVGLINPEYAQENKIYAKINLKAGYSIVTSGDYQKYFTYNNRIYSHILDINTKEPVITDIRSISIIIKDPMVGDIYSTSLFMMGSTEAIKFVNNEEDLECIIYKNNGEVLKSANMDQYIIK